jgi:hypothetical protein
MIEATLGAPGAGCCAERSKLDRVASKRVADTKTRRAYLRAEIEALLQSGVYTILAVLEFLFITTRCFPAPRYRYAKHSTYLPASPRDVVGRFSTGFRRAPCATRRTKAAARTSTRLGCRPEKNQVCAHAN